MDTNTINNKKSAVEFRNMAMMIFSFNDPTEIAAAKTALEPIVTRVRAVLKERYEAAKKNRKRPSTLPAQAN